VAVVWLAYVAIAAIIIVTIPPAIEKGKELYRAVDDYYSHAHAADDDDDPYGDWELDDQENEREAGRPRSGRTENERGNIERIMREHGLPLDKYHEVSDEIHDKIRGGAGDMRENHTNEQISDIIKGILDKMIDDQKSNGGTGLDLGGDGLPGTDGT